jgi:hypothetical protein
MMRRSSVASGSRRRWMIRRRKSRLRIWWGRGLGHLSVLCHDDLAKSIFRFQSIKETFLLPEDARGASWCVCGGKRSERVESSQAVNE